MFEYDFDCNNGRVKLPKQMNFRKSFEGGGVIFNPNIYIADFGPLTLFHPRGQGRSAPFVFNKGKNTFFKRLYLANLNAIPKLGQTAYTALGQEGDYADAYDMAPYIAV